MGLFTAGQVALLPFPFSDLSRNKLRPAVLLANAGREDWIVCQITSNPYGSFRSLQIDSSDFVNGALRYTSYIRPSKVFTAHESLIGLIVGTLTPEAFMTIRGAVVASIEGR